MPAKSKTPLTKLRALLEKMDSEELQEVRRFLEFIKARRTKKDLRQFVNPVETVLMAASQAEAMRHKNYDIVLLHKIAAHNEAELVPALCKLMQWALDVQREVNQIDAKLIAQLLEAKKVGRRAS